MAASEQAIEELYRSRYASFRGGVAAILGGHEAARDVVQEAFAQALRDREQYRGEGSLAAWVWQIAFRIALRSRSTGKESWRSTTWSPWLGFPRRTAIRSWLGR